MSESWSHARGGNTSKSPKATAAAGPTRRCSVRIPAQASSTVKPTGTSFQITQLGGNHVNSAAPNSASAVHPPQKGRY